MMSVITPVVCFGVAGSCLVGVGLYIVVTHESLLRRIIGLNVMGAGIFLMFGAVALRGRGAGFGGDPVPQALVITGIVVAFSATALAIAMLQRLFDISRPAGTDPADRDTKPGPSHDAG